MGRPVRQDATRISFVFSAPDEGYAIEKDVGGQRRKYLRGVASGPRRDHHGERMTAECIKDFMEQANSGDVCLFADMHGVRFTEDIGILESAQVLDSGDWWTEFRLYDESDGVDQRSVEVADKLWKQVNGFHPYSHPQRRGFSIEGYVPEDAPKSVQGDAITKVDLDGVVVVKRPAYKTSVAEAVAKALGADTQKDYSGGMLRQKLAEQKRYEEFSQDRWAIEDALRQTVNYIMSDPYIQDRRAALIDAYEEYGELMVDLTLRHEDLFCEDDDYSEGSDLMKGIERMKQLIGRESNGVESTMRSIAKKL